MGEISEKDFFAIHINFGNEELTSEVRVVLKISKELSPALEWIWEKKDPFSIDMLFDQMNQIERSRLLKLLKVVCYNGLVIKQ